MNEKFSATIRPVREDDLDSIKLILEEWMRDEQSGERLADDISHTLADMAASIAGDTRREYVVAQLPDGSVIGVMGMADEGIDPTLFAPSDKPVELLSAYVERSHRGTGVGRALADELEAMATDLGYTRLIVVSGSRNRETGYAFWNKRYGKPARYDEDFYGEGQERVVWTKELSTRHLASG